MANSVLLSLIRKYVKQEMALGRLESGHPVTLPPEPGDCKAILKPKAEAAPNRPQAQGGGFFAQAVPKALASRTAAPAPTKLRTPFAPQGLGKGEQLRELREYMEKCQLCPLYAERTRLVFGTGNPDAAIMMVGEAPGEDEDLMGEPFVGKAGQLLTDIIEKGMKIPRKEIYIANILKCRPPGNRDPQENEIASCTDALLWQIKIVRPKAIIALGSFAARYLLNTKNGIKGLRGQFYTYRLDGMEIPLMPTYHPSYVLREYTPTVRRQVWEDVTKVMQLTSQPASNSKQL